jgi:hypothetical protein
MNFDKYNPLAKDEKRNVELIQAKEQAVDIPTQLEDWKDSAPVVRLSEYLKDNKDQGIKLIMSNGHPALSFEPGLTKATTTQQKERWQIATNCLSLLQDALSDLRYLISIGRIHLPTSSTGPPGDINP